jgi:hypothetical protein
MPGRELDEAGLPAAAGNVAHHERRELYHKVAEPIVLFEERIHIDRFALAGWHGSLDGICTRRRGRMSHCRVLLQLGESKLSEVDPMSGSKM